MIAPAQSLSLDSANVLADLNGSHALALSRVDFISRATTAKWLEIAGRATLIDAFSASQLASRPVTLISKVATIWMSAVQRGGSCAYQIS
ncbi:hypothetical protein [Bradyrhizobium sp. RDI18]|uniref:hypothetical protein n=1 Tax=Bradyrhizobium sp. RDI18 TaxID=3367400 RepID=UPI0037106058